MHFSQESLQFLVCFFSFIQILNFALDQVGYFADLILRHFVEVDYDALQNGEFEEEVGDDLAHLDCACHSISSERVVRQDDNNTH